MVVALVPQTYERHFPLYFFQKNKVTKWGNWLGKERDGLHFDLMLPPKHLRDLVPLFFGNNYEQPELPDALCQVWILSLTWDNKFQSFRTVNYKYVYIYIFVLSTILNLVKIIW